MYIYIYKYIYYFDTWHNMEATILTGSSKYRVLLAQQSSLRVLQQRERE